MCDEQPPHICGHPLYSRLWNLIGGDDRSAYCALRRSTRDRSDGRRESHLASFQHDLNAVLRFIDRRPERREERAILAGLYTTGSFICVNTRMLKSAMGRCKSSLNNGFQSLGFVSAKAKSKQWFASCLPSLVGDPNIFRQWTIRCAEGALPRAPAAKCSAARQPLPIPQLGCGSAGDAPESPPPCGFLFPSSGATYDFVYADDCDFSTDGLFTFE